MVDFRGPPYQFPSRKPPPQRSGVDAILRPLTKIVPDSQLSSAGQQQTNSTSSHSRSRTSSSSVFPQVRPSSTSSPQRQNFSPSSYQNTMNSNSYAARRTPSNATASTSTTGGDGTSPARTHSNASVSLRRSTSSRSGASTIQCGYVALMRKQKATVWCDRSQHEDPRFLAQQKAARLRAVMEVNGGSQGRASTSGSLGSGGMGVRSKIRYHGAPKAVGYTPGNLVGGGVPMRLSASEVGDEGSDDEDADSARFGQRTESGRSSFGSNRRYGGPKLPGRFSQGSTPSNGQGSSPEDETPELAETPVPGSHQRTGTSDYFTQPSGQETSGGSGSSGERQFGDMGKLAAPSGSHLRADTGKSADELRRRGSVDDRTMTMSGVRLFVANPDLSD